MSRICSRCSAPENKPGSNIVYHLPACADQTTADVRALVLASLDSPATLSDVIIAAHTGANGFIGVDMLTIGEMILVNRGQSVRPPLIEAPEATQPHPPPDGS
jgi:hypothetical protein